MHNYSMDNSYEVYRHWLDQLMASGYPKRLRASGDVSDLQEGLADLVRIGYGDPRDDLMGLAALWLAAAYNGIDPLPYFQEASRTASPDDPYGAGSVRDMLANFHTFAIFREAVIPFLSTSLGDKERE